MVNIALIIALILLIIAIIFYLFFRWKKKKKKKRKYGTYRNHVLDSKIKRYVGSGRIYHDKLPIEYDLRDHHTLCDVLDQGECESCWAFSTCQAVSDRMRIKDGLFSKKIKYNDKEVINSLSPYSMVSCVGNVKLPERYQEEGFYQYELEDMGCQGGFIPYALLIMKLDGVVDLESCTLKYDACPLKQKKHTIRNFYKVSRFDKPSTTQDHMMNELAIMHEIYHNGPVVCSYDIYTNHLTGKNSDGSPAFDRDGVYLHTDGKRDQRGIGHAVSIVGWDKDNWICRNSYGSDDPIIPGNGYFKMRKGENFCNIETDVWAAEV